MDRKSKEALRRYKKARAREESSSESSSSSESDSGSSSSYSSSDSERKASAVRRHRKKKVARSGDERRSKREKRDHCQKKLEATRDHLKRKLKEARLKKRAAAAAAVLSGHSHRNSLSPSTQAKLKKLAERKHLRAANKERREREKHHAAREREQRIEHHHSRSPSKIAKLRLHQEAIKQRQQKSPPRVHHQLMSREKIIIQTRTRERTPSLERERERERVQRHNEHKLRHDERRERDRERERAEREAARNKERAEALARCQERQRERERLAREKLRREEEEQKKYGGSTGSGGSGNLTDRLLPRNNERDIVYANSRGYPSRERSLESLERSRHASKRELDVYEHERDYLEVERHGLLSRDEIRRERDFLTTRHREPMSPMNERYASRLRDPRDLYVDDERDRSFGRTYQEDASSTDRHARDHGNWLDPRDLRERDMHDLRDPRDYREREHDLIYTEPERERLLRERKLPTRSDWKNDWDMPRERAEWEDRPTSNTLTQNARPSFGGGGGGPKRGNGSNLKMNSAPTHEKRASSEPDWDVDEVKESNNSGSNNVGNTNKKLDTPLRDNWLESHEPLEKPTSSGSNTRAPELTDRRPWQGEWHSEGGNETTAPCASGGSGTPVRGRNFRERPGSGGYRGHPPALMTLPVQPPGGYHNGSPRFPNKRNMTYTNPNLIKKQQAALASVKAAAQASAVAAATTAVAAAKAAAQSAANATTNPGILGQVRQQQQYTDKLEAGEIVADNAAIESQSTITAAPALDKVSGELSEISDSDDEILNKAEKRTKLDDSPIEEMTAADSQSATIEDVEPNLEKNAVLTSVETELEAGSEIRIAEDEDMLDFEEISDGELEEDARHKSVSDALGVDWASLIQETKQHATDNAVSGGENVTTTAKQRWQPHRVLLDVGVSWRLAGEEYAKRLLNESQQKLLDEISNSVALKLKSEIKIEPQSSSADEESSQTSLTPMDTDGNVTDTQEVESNIATKIEAEEQPEQSSNSPRIPAADELTGRVTEQALACAQVAERQGVLARQQMFVKVCGPHSRALSARQDLKLRRQLCGLPADECDFPSPIPAVSQKLKAMALAAFQRTLEVK